MSGTPIIDIVKLKDKLFALGSIRGATTTSKVIIVERRMTLEYDYYMFVMSQREPFTAILPFNVLWMPFDTASPDYKKILRRFAKEPIPGSMYNNSWREIVSVEDILSEEEYYDICDSTLRGDYVPNTPFVIYPASPTVTGTVSLSVVDENANYPVVVGDNDVRMTNMRVPLEHEHLEFNERPALSIVTPTGTLLLETLTAPQAGQILNIIPDPQDSSKVVGQWRFPVVSDVSGYVSPAKTLRILGPAAINYQTPEHSTITLQAEIERYSGAVEYVTTETVFAVTGVSNVSVVNNVVSFGEVEENTTALITATYLDPVTNTVLSAQQNVAVLDVYAPVEITISGPNEINELTTGTFTTTVRYSDGSVSDATSRTQWFVNNLEFARFDDNILTALDVSAGGDKRVPVIVTASFTESNLPIPVTVTATKTVKLVDLDLVLPVSLTIIGPTEVTEGTDITYIPRVTYNNGTYNDLPIQGLSGPIWSSPFVDVVEINSNPGNVNVIRFKHILHSVDDVELLCSYTYQHPQTLLQTTLTDQKLIRVGENNIIANIVINGPDEINENTSGSYTASVEYDDGFTEEVSDHCVWHIKLPSGIESWNTGSVDFIINSRTLVVRELFGDVTPLKVQADYNVNGVLYKGSKDVTLKDVTPYPETINILGATSVGEQLTESYAATVTYTNGTTVPRTVTWSSSDPTLASFVGSDLTVTDITEDHVIQLTAEYSETIDGHVVSITSAPFDVTLVHQPPVIISIEAETVSGNTEINENDTTGEQIKITRYWSNGSTDILVDLSSVAFTVDANSAPYLFVSTAGVVTTGNVMEDKMSTITATWTDPDTTVTHTYDLGIVVKYVSPNLLSMAFDQTGPVDIVEHTTATFTLTGSFDDGTTAPIPASAVENWMLTSSYSDLVTFNATTNVLTVLARGIVEADAPVAGTIEATYQGQTASININVQLANLILLTLVTETGDSWVNEGDTIDMKLTAEFDNGIRKDVADDSEVVWDVVDPTIATITNGLLNALDVDMDKTTDITATYRGITATFFDFIVKYVPPELDHIVLSLDSNDILETDTLNVTSVMAHLDDLSSSDVKASAVYTVDPPNKGSFSGVTFTPNDPNITADTPVTITANYGGKTDSAAVTIRYVQKLSSVAITAAQTTILEGSSLKLHYIETYDNGDTLDKSADPSIVWSVDPATGVLTLTDNEGNVTADDVTGNQTATVTATLGANAPTIDINVLDIVPVSLAIDAGYDAQIFEGETTTLTATATLTDSSTLAIPSTDLNFSSSDGLAATVDTDGLVTGQNVDTDTDVIITVEYALNTALTDTATIRVRDVVPTNLVLSTVASANEESTGHVLTVTAQYNDGSSAVVFGNDGAVISLVDPADSAYVTITDSGTAFHFDMLTVDSNKVIEFKAEFEGLEAFATATIVDIPHVTSISITAPLQAPQNEIAEGGVVQLQAIAHYSNGNTVDITANGGTAWTTDTPLAANVNTSGKVTTYNVTDPPVVVTISATYDAIQGDYILRVVNSN